MLFPIFISILPKMGNYPLRVIFHYNNVNNMTFSYIILKMPEELTLDYAEITSIPPLPLWTLLAADKEVSGNSQKKEEVKVCVSI